MKIILLQDEKKLGKKGDIIEASEGYARNFILKTKKGIEANAKNMNDLKLKRQNDDKVAAEQLEAAKELAKKLGEGQVKLAIKVGKDGRAFGSISSKEIAAAVKGKTKIIVDGGIRSGVDVFRAIALGADAVLIGRPVLTAIYGGGEEGVQLLTNKIKAELEDTMAMCGAKDLASITRDMVFLK